MIKVAIVGTGFMANFHAKMFGRVGGCKIVAACDVDRARVEAFCQQHQIPGVYTQLEEMLARAPFDAVSVVTSDPWHLPVTLACLRAGKHVLCEKPLAPTYREAARMATAARKAQVVNMVQFTYRNLSALQGVKKAVERGDIGELRHIEASYLQGWLSSKLKGDWRKTPRFLWRLSTRHGSMGVLGDLGVHLVDFATYAGGPIRQVYCQLKNFPKAKGNRIGEYVLDANDSAVLNVEFVNGVIGTLHTTRWCGGHADRIFLKLAGTKGAIEIDTERSTTGYRICRGRNLDKSSWEEVEVKATPTNHQRFIAAIKNRRFAPPDFARGAEIQKVLDACFRSDRLGRAVRI